MWGIINRFKKDKKRKYISQNFFDFINNICISEKKRDSKNFKK